MLFRYLALRLYTRNAEPAIREYHGEREANVPHTDDADVLYTHGFHTPRCYINVLCSLRFVCAPAQPDCAEREQSENREEFADAIGFWREGEHYRV